MEKYFKAVSTYGYGENTKFYSGFVGLQQLSSPKHSEALQNLLVEYKVGEWVRPILDYTRLMVFTSLVQAKGFARNWCHKGAVFACEVKNPIVCPMDVGFLSIWDQTSDSEIIEFWSTIVRNRYAPDTRGGVAVEQVKLLHEVDITNPNWIRG